MSLDIRNISSADREWIKNLGINTGVDGNKNDISIEDLVAAQEAIGYKFENALEKLFGRLSRIKPTETAVFENELIRNGKRDILSSAISGIEKDGLVSGLELFEKAGIPITVNGSKDALELHKLNFFSDKNKIGIASSYSQAEFLYAEKIPADQKPSGYTPVPAGQKIKIADLEKIQRVEVNALRIGADLEIVIYNKDGTKDIIIVHAVGVRG